MFSKYILTSILLFSSCHLFFPERDNDGDLNNSTQNNTVNNTQNHTISNTNATNQSNNNSTTSQTNNTTTHTTTGTINYDIPFSSIIQESRSRKGLIAQWNFDDLGAEKVLDKSGIVPSMDLVGDNGITRLENTHGIKIDSGKLSADSITTVFSEITSNNAFTIEIWLKGNELNTKKNLSIFTFGEASGNTNFTLSQNISQIDWKLRTEDSGVFYHRKEGKSPLVVDHKLSSQQPTHIILTYTGYSTDMWINGEFEKRMPLPRGLGNWKPEFKFQIGDSIKGNQQWKGEIYYLSFYNRALDAKEIAHHFDLGSAPDAKILQARHPIEVKKCTQWPFDLLIADDFELFKKRACTSIKGNVHIEKDTNGKLSTIDKVTFIGGDLILKGTNETKLSALADLQTIGGNLIIKDNSALASLSFLSSLSSVGKSIIITNNDALKNFNGLNGITTLSEDFIINNNFSLTHLSGLENLTSIGGALILNNAPKLRILELPSLDKAFLISFSDLPSESIQLPSIKNLEHLWIREMPKLKTILSVAKHYYIYRNNLLQNLTFPTTAETKISIAHNFEFHDFAGLSGNEEIGEIYSSNNALNAIKLDGLKNATQISIIDSNILTLENEFPKLEGVEILAIEYMKDLTSMKNAFPKLIMAKEISIDNLLKIKSVNNAFTGLTTAEYIAIGGNDMLPQCDALAFIMRVIVTRSSALYGNDVDGICN